MERSGKTSWEVVNTINWFFVALAACAFALLGEQSAAQGPARKTVRVVVTTPAGPADLVARPLAEQIGRTQGQAMVVENRPGASTAIGTETLAPDRMAARCSLTPRADDPLNDAEILFKGPGPPHPLA